MHNNIHILLGPNQIRKMYFFLYTATTKRIICWPAMQNYCRFYICVLTETPAKANKSWRDGRLKPITLSAKRMIRCSMSLSLAVAAAVHHYCLLLSFWFLLFIWCPFSSRLSSIWSVELNRQYLGLSSKVLMR